MKVRLDIPGASATASGALRPVKSGHILDWMETWVPSMWDTATETPLYTDSPWDWAELIEECITKPKEFEGYAILEESTLHGLTQFGLNARDSFGNSALVVEYLATAPWNRPPLRKRGRVGSLLIGHAIRRSIDLGYEGRIGLHALPEAEPFYERAGMCVRPGFGYDQEYRWYEFDPCRAAEFYSGIKDLYEE